MLRVAVLLLLLAAMCAAEGSGCYGKNTCDKCVGAGSSCKWCVDPGFEGLAADRCAANFEVGEEGRGYGCEAADAVVQVQSENDTSESFTKRQAVDPSQSVLVQLRSDDSHTLTFNVRAEPKMRIEMVYMVDGSSSMEKTINNTRNSAKILLPRVKEEFQGSRFAFAVFNDKETNPFTNLDAHWDKVTSKVASGQVLPYWNLVSELTDDAGDFNEKLTNLKIPTMKDPDKGPEASIDTLLKVIQCQSILQLTGDEAGDDRARHIALVSTDDVFWVAGDGKYAGITQPAPDSCPTPDNLRGEQLNLAWRRESFKYDYPSISRLRHAMRDARMYSVFQVSLRDESGPAADESRVINEHVKSVYSNMEAAIPEYFEFVTDPVRETANERVIADNVMDILNRISSRVALAAYGDGMNKLQVSYAIRCPDTLAQLVDQAGEVVACENMQERDVAQIDVTIRRKDPNDHEDVEFSLDLPGVHRNPPLFLVKVEDKPIECDCPDSSYPTDCVNGLRKCGVCLCDPGWYGEKCDCNEVSTSSSELAKCTPEGADGQLCSDNGECYCGQCVCRANSFGQQYFGKFCECDQSRCPKDENGDQCFGRGSCSCFPGHFMQCQCSEPDKYDKETNCECVHQSACLDKDSGKICNDRSAGGRCGCDGFCLCQQGFTGPLCEQCQQEECRTALCQEPQVREAAEECVGNSACHPKTLRDVRAWSLAAYEQHTDAPINESLFFECGISVDDCNIEVRVSRADIREYVVLARHCPEKFNLWIIVLIVALLVLLIGLAVIVGWKLYIHYLEKKEYEQFMKDQQNSKANVMENPLHRSAEKTVVNPNLPSNN